MKIGLSLKIDVSKIDKERLFKGAKGTYLDATIFVDADNLDQYGNSGMITQDVTKDEKEAGTKGAILGNGKVFWKDGNKSMTIEPIVHPNKTGGVAPVDDGFDKIPF